MTYPTLVLDKLNTVLNKAGIDDHMIVGGVQLTHVGYQKLAAAMKLTGGQKLKNLNDMVNELIVKLRSDQSMLAEEYDDLLDEETGEKYTSEKDFLGNITIRNTETGDEKFLQGWAARELINALAEPHVDKQELLSLYFEKSDSLTEEDEDVQPSDSYESEIDSSEKGSYNFPWKYREHHGFGTVEFYGRGKDAVINLISVRNASGDEIEVSDALEAALKQQAIAFIGDA